MRGRRLVIEWEEDAETLQSLYRTESNAELRPRMHALWLLRSGRRLAEVAEIVGIHYATLQQWVRWYRVGGVKEVRSHRKGGRQGKASYLTVEQERALVEAAKKGSFHTVGEMEAWIEKQYQVTYRPGSFYFVCERLGLKKKVPRPLSEKADLAAQEEWKKRSGKRGISSTPSHRATHSLGRLGAQR